jgi:DNA primase
VLSVRTAVPAMPMAAALSSGHLGVFRPPYTLRRLYIAQDNDPAGELAALKLSRSVACVGIEPIVLRSMLKDFNDDLRQFGVDALQAALRKQLRPEDAARFFAPEAEKVGGDVVPLQPDPGDGPPAGGPRPRACEGAI